MSTNSGKAPHERVALITGAGSGIGRATALEFIRDGYRVVLAGRRQAALEGTLAEFAAGAPHDAAVAKKLAERTLLVATDVTDPDSVAALFEAAQAKFGRLDVLFNNAGISAPGVPIEELTCEQWRAVVETNLTGPFLCTQQAVRLMKSQKPQGGRIINNGSISAQSPRPNSAPYTATKHAITGLTKSTSLDGRKYNIACGQIDIGNALTEMAQRMTQGVPQADGSIMVEPVMDVKHVAETVLHMASLPLEANVQFVTIMATKMPLIGRG